MIPVLLSVGVVKHLFKGNDVPTERVCKVPFERKDADSENIQECFWSVFSVLCFFLKKKAKWANVCCLDLCKSQ